MCCYQVCCCVWRRRAHDARPDDVKGASATEQQLARRVFMVLMRM